jgi:transcriptional regulator with XRE-family HTH domain
MTYESYRKRVGRRLVELRRQAELTQAEVAERAGITRQHVGLLELGSKDPKLSTMFALARAFGVSVAKIVDL